MFEVSFSCCPAEDGDPDLRIVSFLKREEVARRVVQAYTLQRVQRRDWPTVLKLLACIGQVGCCCGLITLRLRRLAGLGSDVDCLIHSKKGGTGPLRLCCKPVLGKWAAAACCIAVMEWALLH